MAFKLTRLCTTPPEIRHGGTSRSRHSPSGSGARTTPQRGARRNANPPTCQRARYWCILLARGQGGAPHAPLAGAGIPAPAGRGATCTHDHGQQNPSQTKSTRQTRGGPTAIRRPPANVPRRSDIHWFTGYKTAVNMHQYHRTSIVLMIRSY